MIKKFLMVTAAIAGFLLVILIRSAFIAASPDIGLIHPTTTADFAKTSVKITDMTERRGGTGVILISTLNESVVMTNRHVCRLIQNGGGVVTSPGGKFLISSFKISKAHDLCQIKVSANLHYTTEVASAVPVMHSSAFVSGHPALLPHVLTTGAFSGRMIVNVLSGMRPCTPEEEKKPDLIMQCILGGGIPLIETLESQLVTATIMPGSSGSAVFDSSGFIAGVVFAGMNRDLSYAFIVPLEYVSSFVRNEAPSMDWSTPTPLDLVSILERERSYERSERGEKLEIVHPIFQGK